MSEPIFYVKPVGSSELIPATFLQYNGQYVVDPNQSVATNYSIYDANGNLINNANPYGYIIAPANFNIQAASEAAVNQLNQTAENAASAGGDPTAAAAGQLIGMFEPGGDQDLQRSYGEALDGSTPTVPVAAFQDVANLYYAYVGAQFGLSQNILTEAGGLAHYYSYVNSVVNGNALPDISGTDGNSPQNLNSQAAVYNLYSSNFTSSPENGGIIATSTQNYDNGFTGQVGYSDHLFYGDASNSNNGAATYTISNQYGQVVTQAYFAPGTSISADSAGFDVYSTGWLSGRKGRLGGN